MAAILSLRMYGRSARLDEIATRKREVSSAHQEAVIEQRETMARQDEKLAD